MQYFSAVIWGLFGLIVGSFLNVVILRRASRGLGGRSGCLHCRHELGVADLVPIASWIALRGKCRYCGSALSMQYPIVEALTALLFALVGAAQVPFGIMGQAYLCFELALLLAIAAYDMRHTIIPDEWVWPFAFAALLGATFQALYLPSSLLFALAAGPLCALLPFALWAVSRGRWMGLGDAKLMLGIGWLLGLFAGFYALFISFVIGACISVSILLIGRVVHRRMRKGRASRLTMKSEVPFGPYLAGACAIALFGMLYGLPLPFFYL